VATSGTLGADMASVHLEALVHELTQRAFRSGLASDTEESLEGVAGNLLSMADELERTHTERRNVARWLRGRALEAVVHTLDHAPLDLQRELAELATHGAEPQKALALSEGRIERVARLGSLVQALRSGGALERDAGELDNVWQKAVSRVEDSLVALWDDALRAAVASALRDAKPGDLAEVLEQLAEPLAHVEQAGRRFTELGAGSTTLKERVIGARIALFVRAAFEHFDARDRKAVAAEVDSVLAVLRRHGLERALAPEALLTFCAEALLRAETPSLPLGDFSPDHAGYRRLRESEERSSLAFVLADVGLRFLPELKQPSSHPDDVIAGLARRLGTLPEALRSRVAARDLERIERIDSPSRALLDGTVSRAPEGSGARPRPPRSLGFFHDHDRRGGALPFRARAPIARAPGTRYGCEGARSASSGARGRQHGPLA
jgi:hypothetical protein